MDTHDKLRIAAATRDDVAIIHTLICELADYERLAHAVSATPERLAETLFGPRPAAEVLLARLGDSPVGFALFFPNYSTFLGKPGIYLEDLYVRPAFRGRGIGRALLSQIVGLARQRDCGRVEWAVLNWNEPAIGFYRSLGARPLDDWIIFRLTGDALAQLDMRTD